MSPPSPTSPRIGIVGAGPGGLFTAHRLQHHADTPYELTLLEADARVGGKIVTGRFTARAVDYEIGAAELYDHSPIDVDPLRELVRELGLATVPMSGNSVILDRRVLANLDDVRQACGSQSARALREFDARARDRMSPREFYEADDARVFADETAHVRFDALLESLDDDAARRWVETLVHSDLATQPERTNVRYGLQNYLMNDPRYMRLYSIVGGNEQLPRALAERLAGRVVTGQRATSIARDGDQWRVLTDGADGSRAWHFDHLVIALPLDALRKLRFEDARLAAAIARHVAYHDHPAHYLRISMLFERPFWRAQMHESFFMLDAFGGTCLYDESSRLAEPEHGVLGWLLGGEPARELASQSDEQLVRLALDNAPPFLARAREHLLEARVHRWIDSVNAMPGGVRPLPHALRHAPAGLGEHDLLLVGDYLYDSTLNGVLESADHVARCLAARRAAPLPAAP